MGLAGDIIEDQLRTLSMVTEGLTPYRGYLDKHSTYAALFPGTTKARGGKGTRPALEKTREYVARRRARRHGARVEHINHRAVFDKTNGQCAICLKVLSFTMRTGPEGWHLDHIRPLSRGGAHTYDNVQALCRRCNLSKSNG